MPRFKAYESKAGGFSCKVPDWAWHSDAREEGRTKVYGIHLSGPRSPEGAATTIHVRHFARGNTLSPDAAAYLKRQLEPGPVPLRGEKSSAVEEVEAAGLPARRFTRETFAYLPPSSMDTKEIPVREEHYVLDRGKGKGFDVVSFTAPAAIFEAQRPVFQRVLNSFKRGSDAETKP